LISTIPHISSTPSITNRTLLNDTEYENAKTILSKLHAIHNDTPAIQTHVNGAIDKKIAILRKTIDAHSTHKKNKYDANGNPSSLIKRTKKIQKLFTDIYSHLQEGIPLTLEISDLLKKTTTYKYVKAVMKSPSAPRHTDTPTLHKINTALDSTIACFTTVYRTSYQQRLHPLFRTQLDELSHRASNSFNMLHRHTMPPSPAKSLPPLKQPPSTSPLANVNKFSPKNENTKQILPFCPSIVTEETVCVPQYPNQLLQTPINTKSPKTTSKLSPPPSTNAASITQN
jgi:hypothetical protein